MTREEWEELVRRCRERVKKAEGDEGYYAKMYAKDVKALVEFLELLGLA